MEFCVDLGYCVNKLWPNIYWAMASWKKKWMMKKKKKKIMIMIMMMTMMMMIIIQTYSFYVLFSKLEYIAHYKAKNQSTVKTKHPSQ